MRMFSRLLHLFFLGRAVSRGPRYFARYEARRIGRRAVYHATRSRRHR